MSQRGVDASATAVHREDYEEDGVTEAPDDYDRRVNYQRRLTHLVCNNKITRDMFKDMCSYVESGGTREAWVVHVRNKYASKPKRIDGVRGSNIPEILEKNFTTELPPKARVVFEFVSNAFGNQSVDPVDCIKRIGEGVSLDEARGHLLDIGMGPGMEIGVVVDLIEKFDGGNPESVRLFYIDRTIDAADEVTRLSVFYPESIEELALGPLEPLKSGIVDGLLSIQTATVKLHEELLYDDEEQELVTKGGETHWLATKMSHIRALERAGCFLVATNKVSLAENLVGTVRQGSLYVGRLAKKGEEADDPLKAPASREILVPACVNRIYSAYGIMPGRNFYCSDEVVRQFVSFIKGQQPQASVKPPRIAQMARDDRMPAFIPQNASSTAGRGGQGVKSKSYCIDFGTLLSECSNVNDVMRTFNIGTQSRDIAKNIAKYNKVSRKVLSELDGVEVSIDGFVDIVRTAMGPTHGRKDEEVAIAIGLFAGNLVIDGDVVHKR